MKARNPCKGSAYLVFCKGGNRIFNFFLKKNFSHVFILRQHEKGWAVIDPCQCYFKTNVIDHNFDLPKFYARKGCTVLQVIKLYQPPLKNRLLPKFIPVLTCVALAKYALITKSISITPWQLYKFLIKSRSHLTREVKP